MLKKIALATIFAAVSVVSFTSSQVNAGQRNVDQLESFTTPVMKGLCAARGRC